MNRKITVSVFVSCLCIIASPVHALTRSCEAYYLIHPRNFAAQDFKFAGFSPKGYCGNKAVANRCRERARDRAHRCMKDHWNVAPMEVGRNEGEGFYEPPPKTCRDEQFDSSTVLNYPIERLFPALSAEICKRYAGFTEAYEQGKPVYEVDVIAVTRGEKRCSRQETLKKRHRIVCGSSASPPRRVVAQTSTVGDSRHIKNIGSGLCLTVEKARLKKGGNIVQWRCHEQGNQLWKIELVPDAPRWYQIINLRSNLCLAVQNGSKKKGANIVQDTCFPPKPPLNQRWFPKYFGKYVQFENQGSKMCLTVRNASNKDGANIIQWNCYEQGNELWKME